MMPAAAEAARIAVGLVLVFAGAVKAIDSRGGVRTAASLRIRRLGHRHLILVVIAGAVLESALGAALLLGAWPSLTIPVAAGLFLALACLTVRAERVGGIEDCGCYGGLVLLTPRQSVLLDGVYVAALVFAWLAGGRTSTAGPRAMTIVATAAIAAAAAAWASRRRALYDLSRLAHGRRWRNRWLPGHDLSRGRHLVIFLSSRCTYCKKWVPFLNVLAAQAQPVLAVMRPGELEPFKQAFKIGFPIATMQPLLFSIMVDSSPTAVLLEDGRIAGTWTGELPPQYREHAHAVLSAVASASHGSRPTVFSG